MAMQKRTQQQGRGRRRLKIRKGDKVVVICGADKGRTGEVLQVLPKEDRVLVQGVNMRTHHNRPSQSGPGGIERKEAPLHVSNVALADPKDGKPTRVGFKRLKDNSKARVARRSGETVA